MKNSRDAVREYLILSKSYYQNVKGLEANLPNSRIYVASVMRNVICLTETWLGGKVFNLGLPDEYTILRCDSDMGGGVLTAVEHYIDALHFIRSLVTAFMIVPGFISKVFFFILFYLLFSHLNIQAWLSSYVEPSIFPQLNNWPFRSTVLSNHITPFFLGLSFCGSLPCVTADVNVIIHSNHDYISAIWFKGVFFRPTEWEMFKIYNATRLFWHFIVSWGKLLYCFAVTLLDL